MASPGAAASLSPSLPDLPGEAAPSPGGVVGKKHRLSSPTVTSEDGIWEQDDDLVIPPPTKKSRPDEDGAARVDGDEDAEGSLYAFRDVLDQAFTSPVAVEERHAVYDTFELQTKGSGQTFTNEEHNDPQEALSQVNLSISGGVVPSILPRTVDGERRQNGGQRKDESWKPTLSAIPTPEGVNRQEYDISQADQSPRFDGSSRAGSADSLLTSFSGSGSANGSFKKHDEVRVTKDVIAAYLRESGHPVESPPKEPTPLLSSPPLEPVQKPEPEPLKDQSPPAVQEEEHVEQLPMEDILAYMRAWDK